MDTTDSRRVIVRIRLLSSALWVGVALGLLVVACGGFAIVINLLDDGWDTGLIGVMMLSAGGVWSGVHVVIALGLADGRRRYRATGEIAGLRRAGVACAVLGVPVCLLCVASLSREVVLGMVALTGMYAAIAVVGGDLAAAVRRHLPVELPTSSR